MPSIFEDSYIVTKDLHTDSGELIHMGTVYMNSHYSLVSSDGLVLQLYRVVDGQRQWLSVKEEELYTYFI